MKIARYIKLSTLLLLLLSISITSCTEQETDLSNLNDTVYVRHKNADMPAFIHGNASDKVFLIILHGGPGGNGLFYRTNTIKSEIEKNNAVVYFDQRGSGLSQGNYDKNGTSIDIMAEDILALARILKHKYGQDSKLFLMGHSWGGTLGPATLLKDQSPFVGWIDVAGAHDPKGSYAQYQESIKEMADQQIALGNSKDFWQNAIAITDSVSPEYNIPDFGKLNQIGHDAEEVYVADGLVDSLKVDYETTLNPYTVYVNSIFIKYRLLKNNDLFGSVSFTDHLHEITLPSLVLWGKYDLVVPFHYAQEAYEKLGSEEKDLFIFQRSGHSMMLNEPDLFSEKVIDFINTYK